MFAKSGNGREHAPCPGVHRRTLNSGERMLMTEFRLEAGHTLPMHSHPQEQSGYLVAGRIALTLGDERRELAPGDSWCIAPDVPHGAEILEDSLALEVFSPVREDYLD